MYRQSLRVALCLAITATVHASPLGEVLYVGDSPRNMILAHVIGSDRLVPLSGATSIMARQAVGLGGNRVAYLPFEREGVVELDLESGALHEFHLAAEGWRIKGLGTITGDGGICLAETNGTESRVTVWRKADQTWTIDKEYPISEVIYLDSSPLAFADNSVIYTRGVTTEIVYTSTEGTETILAEGAWALTGVQLEWGADGIAVASLRGERIGAWNAQGEAVDFAEESGVWTLLPRAIKSSTTGLIGAVSRAGDYVRSSIFGEDTTTVYTSRLPDGRYKPDGDITGTRALWRRPGGGAYFHDNVGGGIGQVGESGAAWHYQFVSGSGPLFDGILSMGTAADGLIRLVDDRGRIFNINPATGNRTVVGTLRRGISGERSVVLPNGDLLSIETEPTTGRVRFVAITRSGAERGAGEWVDAGAPISMAAVGNRAFVRFHGVGEIQHLLGNIDGHEQVLEIAETVEIFRDEVYPYKPHYGVVRLPQTDTRNHAMIVDVDFETGALFPGGFNDPQPLLALIGPDGQRYSTRLWDWIGSSREGMITRQRYRVPTQGLAGGDWLIRIEWTASYAPIEVRRIRLSPLPLAIARSLVFSGDRAGDRLYFHNYGTDKFVVLDPTTMDAAQYMPPEATGEYVDDPLLYEQFRRVSSMVVSERTGRVYSLSTDNTAIYQWHPNQGIEKVLVPAYPDELGAPQLGHRSGGHRFLAIGPVAPSGRQGWILH